MKKVILIAAATALLSSGVAQAKPPSVGNAAVEWCVKVGPVEICRDDGKNNKFNQNGKFKLSSLINPKTFGKGKLIQPFGKGKLIQPFGKGKLIQPTK